MRVPLLVGLSYRANVVGRIDGNNYVWVDVVEQGLKNALWRCTYHAGITGSPPFDDLDDDEQIHAHVEQDRSPKVFSQRMAHAVTRPMTTAFATRTSHTYR
jgi:hypothetical protein